MYHVAGRHARLTGAEGSARSKAVHVCLMEVVRTERATQAGKAAEGRVSTEHEVGNGVGDIIAMVETGLYSIQSPYQLATSQAHADPR